MDKNHELLKRHNGLVVSYLTLRKVIGLLGVSLPAVLILGGMLIFGEGIQQTVSYYYYTGMRNVFVGMLFAIGVGLLSYKGYESKDNVFSNIACMLAVCVALFPTNEDPIHTNFWGYVHLFFAGAFFAVLIYFSYFLFTKIGEDEQPSRQKILRNRVYRACGISMAGCIFFIMVYSFLPETLKEPLRPLNPIFWLESLAIISFGISWLTKGESIFKDLEKIQA